MAPESTTADPATEVDGRRLRREQNREAVLDALVELFREGIFQPSANEIAERSGLSPRSLFRYFEDVEDLNRAAIERHLATARPLFDLGIDAQRPTAEKIQQLVEARVRLWDAVEPTARAARVVSHRRPIVAERLDATRSLLRSQVVDVFGPELTGDRAALLPAIDALCEFESYELLRRAQGLSKAKTVAALVAALTAMLVPDDGR